MGTNQGDGIPLALRDAREQRAARFVNVGRAGVQAGGWKVRRGITPAAMAIDDLNLGDASGHETFDDGVDIIRQPVLACRVRGEILARRHGLAVDPAQSFHLINDQNAEED